MKIIILGTRGFPNIQGGVEKHCEGLSTNLVKLGCEVIVFTRKPYIKHNIKEYQGVKLIALPTLKHKSLEAFLHTLIGVCASLRHKPDILHIQAIGPALLTPLAKILGMKVVLTTHGSNYKHLKWGKFSRQILKFGEYLGVTFADKIIGISDTIATEIWRKYHKTAIVIPNGINITKKLRDDSIIRKYGLEEGKFILTVGRFVPEKGFHDLIEAFNQFPITNYKLVIVGRADHPDRYSLNLEKKASKNKNIILTGFLTGKPLQELYSHARLFILPSYYEGLPIVLLEAMSYGLSCIASDISANRNVELPRERFFKVGNVWELSKKIKEFVDKHLTDEERRKQLNVIFERYNWERIAEKTLEVYQSVVYGS